MKKLIMTSLMIVVVAVACRQQEQSAPPPAAAQTTAEAQPAVYAPIDRLEPMKIPAENPMTPEKIRLGHQLYFDKRLSGDGQFACYSCHLNERGLTYGKALGTGPFNKPLPRNAPTMWNIGYHTEWYWDGRAKTLEGQALAAWKGVNMGADPDKISAALNAIAGYHEQFQKVFNQPANPENVTKALAAYMRTIISKETPFDRWQRGEQTAISADAQRGYEIFQKAKCDNCHGGVLFTDLQYHNVGIGMKAKEADVGRFKVTNLDRDRGAFKTPTLRDVAESGPYFHDGSVTTLAEAVRIMANGGIDNPHLDRVNLQPANLNAADLRALVTFLESLSEPTQLPAPELPQ